jgi:hypothetical protein
LGYPVAFTKVTIYLDWSAKDNGIMIAWFISIQNNEILSLAWNNIRYNKFLNVHWIKAFIFILYSFFLHCLCPLPFYAVKFGKYS